MPLLGKWLVRSVVCILATFMLLSLVCFLFGGCTEAMRRGIDTAAQGTAGAGHGVRETIKSPAGDLVPEPVRSAVLAGAVAIEAAALAWLRTRKKQADKSVADLTERNDTGDEEYTELNNEHAKTMGVLKMLTKAVEQLPDEVRADFKGIMASQMAKESPHNAIIDQAKQG